MTELPGRPTAALATSPRRPSLRRPKDCAYAGRSESGDTVRTEYEQAWEAAH